MRFAAGHAKFMRMAQPLKLKAQSPSDLEVMSAVLQDAVVRVGDIAHLRDSHRFALVASRYCWESMAKAQERKNKGKQRRGERVRTGLHFDTVLKAEAQNVPMREDDHVMELLAIEVEETAEGEAVIDLKFSGFATIRLRVECIEAYLKDLTDPWLALSRPEHAVD